MSHTPESFEAWKGQVHESSQFSEHDGPDEYALQALDYVTDVLSRGIQPSVEADAVRAKLDIVLEMDDQHISPDMRAHARELKVYVDERYPEDPQKSATKPV